MRTGSALFFATVFMTSPTFAQETGVSRQEAPTNPSVEAGGRLDLICDGGGSANKPNIQNTYGSATATNAYGSTYAQGSATTYGMRSEAFGDQTTIIIEGGEGRIRMPVSLVPVIRGGEDGWFKLKKIQVKPDEIIASIGLNFLNNPKMRIDRLTGAISISGSSGTFVGQCQQFDPRQTERRF